MSSDSLINSLDNLQNRSSSEQELSSLKFLEDSNTTDSTIHKLDLQKISDTSESLHSNTQDLVSQWNGKFDQLKQLTGEHTTAIMDWVEFHKFPTAFLDAKTPKQFNTALSNHMNSKLEIKE